MKAKQYRLAFIYEDRVVPKEDFVTNSYKVAYEEAIFKMKEDKETVSTLIYSNTNTALVIQRKYADKGYFEAPHATYTEHHG